MISTFGNIGGIAGARTVVTGSAGLVGRHLCEALASLGADVIALDARPTEALDTAGRIQIVTADVTDENVTRDVIGSADVVFHNASLKIPDSAAEPARAIGVLVAATRTIADACALNNCRLVFASSGAVYGEPDFVPITETHPLRSRSLYAALKVAGEQIIQSFVATQALRAISLRYFSVYGPGMALPPLPAEVLAIWCSEISAGRAPRLAGSGSQLFDFTHVADVVRCNLLSAVCDSRYGAFNVGTGTPISLEQAARVLIDLSGARLKPLGGAQLRQNSTKQCFPDVSLAHRELGYWPTIRREDGFADLLHWVATRAGAGG